MEFFFLIIFFDKVNIVKALLIKTSENLQPFITYMKFQTMTLWEQYPGFMEHQFLCAVQQNKYLSNGQ